MASRGISGPQVPIVYTTDAPPGPRSFQINRQTLSEPFEKPLGCFESSSWPRATGERFERSGTLAQSNMAAFSFISGTLAADYATLFDVSEALGELESLTASPPVPAASPC